MKTSTASDYSALDQLRPLLADSNLSLETLSYLTNLVCVAQNAPDIANLIIKELEDQRTNLKLIASENYSSIATQAAMGNLLTDKYAEGYPQHRFYAGCDNVDEIELIACSEAKKLFNAEHAYVQPHSGADANLIAYWAILHTKITPKFLENLPKDKSGNVKKVGDLSSSEWLQLRAELGNQRLLALDYYSGGHLTHGYRFNSSAQMFDCYSYTVARDTGLLDYETIRAQAKEIKPLILLTGYSAYPGFIDFARMREIADEVGAVLMVDMAHFAGLVAGRVFKDRHNPVPYAHIVTSTTHKTLRGPRGGIVLCKQEFAEQVDKGCPLVIGGPLPHVMAAKAVAFREANQPQFKKYAEKVVANAKELVKEAISLGMKIPTNNTENHLLLIDVREFGINGRQAESALRSCGITLNRNSLPFDPNGPWFTSGLRVGTPAVTTLGMGEAEMKEIAKVIYLILSNTKAAKTPSGKESKTNFVLDEQIATQARSQVKQLLDRYPVYPEINLRVLKSVVG
jgi:glycine hydroxymethyltransferase